jgi:hypothetical protein
MKTETKWLRHRFRANLEDPRPIKFPPPGPYWITGEGDDYSIVVAYLPPETEVQEFWPEASRIDSDPRDEITYTDRFKKPDWYNPAPTGTPSNP